MVKKYKTINNLNKVWKRLDDALSEINLAVEDLQAMKLDIGDSDLARELEGYDFSELVHLKNSVEELIEEKGGKVVC